MADRAEIARQAADGLRGFAQHVADYPVMIGFDGFVDSIVNVVDTRHDVQRFDSIQTIEQFSRKILAAAGKSGNYELVIKARKLGGNGPIMANALAALGLPVTYVGALGHPKLNPVFKDLANLAHCISIAEPAYTDALEFSDGKVMFGKLESLMGINWQQIGQVVGYDQFASLVAGARLIGMVNWTMLPMLSEIWRRMIDDIMPQLPTFAAGQAERRQIWIDLADPEKRTDDDLGEALELCSAFQPYANVMLGLNLKESTQVLRVLGLEVPADTVSAIETTACTLCKRLNIAAVVIHPRDRAAATISCRGDVESACFIGPLITQPRLSTGAGDNFNAGFCLGLLAHLPLEQALCIGTAASGYYVRHACSPRIHELAEFCQKLPQPETIDL